MAAFWALSVIGDEGEDTIVPNPLILKNRRIIDEWGTGVKRKISLSFKGIIEIARSMEGVAKAAYEAADRGPCRCGPGMAVRDHLERRYRRRGALALQGKQAMATEGTIHPGAITPIPDISWR